MTVTLPTLPIPLISAFLLAWMGARAWRSRRAGPVFIGLIGVCAWQSALIALQHHYGLTALRPVQPLTAALIPPLAWLALQSGGIRPLRRADLLHLGPFLGVTAGLALWPLAIDWILLLGFIAYGTAILWQMRNGADALPRNRLQAGEYAARLWRLIGVGLILSGLSEVLIIVMFVTGQTAWIGWIIGGYATGSLLAIGLLSLSSELTGVSGPDGTALAPAPQQDPARDADDAALVARLRALMQSDPLYKDPDLTLARLARRLGVPAKTLSAAINRHTGENVSRFINALRINEACKRIAAGDSVTDAMLVSGFNTKSNFNREFRRVTGQSPSEWRA